MGFIKFIILCFTLLFISCKCKPSTESEPANCDPGYLPCTEDSTQCCEVICPENNFNCGTNLTDCCTSHNFLFEIDTLGIYGSYLNDVAIVDEDDIWVVGKISMPAPDSTNGTVYMDYNAAHWDGSEWELIRIQPQGYVQNLNCIYYFSDDNIWFSKSTLPIHWDGNSYYLFTPANDGYPGGSIIKDIWATTPNDMFFIGSGGGIVHYNGSSFEQMESGTDVDLIDIAGTPDGEHIFVVGYEISGDLGGHSIVLHLVDGIWEILYSHEGYWPENDSTGAVLGAYVYEDTLYFSRRGGLWKYNYITEESTVIPANENDFDGHGYGQIIVNNLYDIFLKDGGFSLLHFNGENWQTDVSINDLYGWLGIQSGRFDFYNEMIIMVGCYNCSYGRAIVVKGFR